MKKKRLIILIACLAAAVPLHLAVRTQMVARSPVDTDNARNFGSLVMDLVRAYEKPSGGDEAAIEADLERIRAVREDDFAVGQDLADTWREVYLNPDCRLFVCGRDDPAALAEYGVENSPAQAIVILGYKLSGGRMQPELTGRCDAAAVLARACPEAILVCSGGATGRNNPENHTEAGLMKQYLTESCGIDAARIYTDEEAMTTVANVRETFRILEEQGVHTMTIVTSLSHMKRAQALYGVMARVCLRERGYAVRSAGNFCYEAPGASAGRSDHRLAIQGMVELLHLPKDVIPFEAPSDEEAGEAE